MSENLILAIFLQAWLQSLPWPSRPDLRYRILAQFEAINQVADALRRATDGHAPSTHPRGESCRRSGPPRAARRGSRRSWKSTNPFDADRTP
jgi:hypothetical protein